MARHFTLLLTPDPEDGGYTVPVPALPGCNTQGDTLEETIANVRYSFATHLLEGD